MLSQAVWATHNDTFSIFHTVHIYCLEYKGIGNVLCLCNQINNTMLTLQAYMSVFLQRLLLFSDPPKQTHQESQRSLGCCGTAIATESVLIIRIILERALGGGGGGWLGSYEYLTQSTAWGCFWRNLSRELTAKNSWMLEETKRALLSFYPALFSIVLHFSCFSMCLLFDFYLFILPPLSFKS